MSLAPKFAIPYKTTFTCSMARHPIIIFGPEAGSCSSDSVVFLASMDEDKGIEDGNPGCLLLKDPAVRVCSKKFGGVRS
jgi:hypothetical protein